MDFQQKNWSVICLAINNITRYARLFLKCNYSCPSVNNYNSYNYYNEIDGLFVENDIADELKNYCENLVQTRCILADCKNKIIDNDYIAKVENYLEAVKKIMALYFSYPHRKSLILGKNKTILKNIVESDIIPCKDKEDEDDEDTIKIYFGNPMILESLLICYRQREDFYAEFKNKTISGDKESEQKNENYYRRELDRELYVNKFDRLFRDIIILYKKEFYRIVDLKFKDDNPEEVDCFIAKHENVLSSIETFSATRLYEKIIFGRDKSDSFKVLIVGETKTFEYENKKTVDSFDELKTMLALNGYDEVKVEKLSRVDSGFSKIFTYNGLQTYIDEYDKIFILDCPELYYEIGLKEQIDASNIAFKADLSIKDFPRKFVPVGFRSFYNSKWNNCFAPVYYRVQNYLIDDQKVNSSKTRNINKVYLDKIKDIIDQKTATIIDHKADDKDKEKAAIEDDKKKEVYAYISNNRDFVDELYDMYNFTRIERYNSKTCRIVKFSKKHLPEDCNSTHKMLFISLYKILKMLSSDIFFHRMFTASEGMRFAEIAKKSSNINIIIDYSDIYFDTQDGMKCNIKAYYSGIEPDDHLNIIVETLIKEMFRYDESHDAVIKYCYKKAIADIFSGSARNFNDLLFHHLYFKTLTDYYLNQENQNVNFSVKFYKQTKIT